MRTIEKVNSEIKDVNTELETLREKLESKECDVQEKRLEVENFEKDGSEVEDLYEEMLDENGPVDVCGMSFVASRILRELDPTAYNCGLSDFADSLECSQFEGYTELEEELEELENDVSELETQIEELEEELEELEEELEELEEEEAEEDE